MVCPRCISAVSVILQKLNINYLDIRLGEVVLKNEIDEGLLMALSSELEKIGFELLTNNQQQIIDKIKSVIIEQVRYPDNKENNISQILVSKLHKDYSYLSKLFSTTEGITIEHYFILQKTEKVKELLCYDQQTLSEIALELGYSSVAHLSAQFKKVTGLTPSRFKMQGIKLRRGLDSLI